MKRSAKENYFIMSPRLPVVLYIPNVLGYARIILAFVGLHYSATDPVKAVATWVATGFLDLFDGILARALQQTSAFGVFLDVCADNILRSVVWVSVAVSASSSSSSAAFGSNEGSANNGVAVTRVACFLICLEWTTMVSTQVYAAVNNENWKLARGRDPWLVQAFFRSNFRNPLGSLGIYGLFCANLFAYGSYHPVLYDAIPFYNAFMYLAFAGRLISMAIEIWLCCSYFSFILENDRQQQIRNGVVHKSR